MCTLLLAPVWVKNYKLDIKCAAGVETFRSPYIPVIFGKVMKDKTSAAMPHKLPRQSSCRVNHVF